MGYKRSKEFGKFEDTEVRVLFKDGTPLLFIVSVKYKENQWGDFDIRNTRLGARPEFNNSIEVTQWLDEVAKEIHNYYIIH